MTEKQLRGVLARNVEARMAKLGLAQEDVEAKAGLGQTTVSRVLNEGGSATIKSIAALARALDCQPWELLVDDEGTRAAYLTKILGG